jgi:hypothetical protein
MRSEDLAQRIKHPPGAVALTMAAGVLLVSGAYAAGRAGSGGSGWTAVYWTGEAVVFAPLVWRVLSRGGPGETEAAGLTLCLASATYLIKVCYSPSAFRFPDELEHWRTTANLLSSHHLFGANFLLPVSPVYPGLEEATGAVVSLTGLPVFQAGLIVAGLAHLLFAAALYLLFRLVSGSPRIALTACVIYAANPHFQVFDAIYGYQTLGLAFYGLALVAALGIASAGSRASGSDAVRWWALAVMLAAATVVTHHVTSYLLAATLALIAVVGAAARSVRRGRLVGVAVLAAGCAALAAIWVVIAAASAVGYLTPTLRSFTQGLTGVFTAHSAAGGGTPAGPLADQLAGYAASLLIMASLPFGWRRIWRTQRGHAWALALGAGAASYYVLALLRITSPDGAELAGRGLTFAYIPVSYTLAMALDGPGRALLARVPRAAAAALAAAAAGILVFGGLTSGWPPYWERLPGTYVVDGFESGITPEGIAAATWARGELGPGQRIAADFTNYLLLGAYGDLDPVGNLGVLYCGPSWTDLDAGLVNHQALGYLLVDLRMAGYPSVTGGYFTETQPGCPSPIPRRCLAKFDAVPGFYRVYDSGNIVIYALAEA